MKFNNILESIGRTPLIKINRLFPEANAKNISIYIKLERNNPGGSIKDRIAFAMLEDAFKNKLINHDSVIIEPTSGNTGVGLAMACAVYGLRLILAMPESMSLERRRIMSAYGAEIVLTPREKGMKGAILRAEELLKLNDNSWMPMQFENMSNVRIHRETTAKEILDDLPAGVDYLVTGVGTGGHITGVGLELKKHKSTTKVIAVEPIDSPILSGGNPGPHALQGIGAGFIPKILDRSIIDGVIQVSKDESYHFAREAAKQEGILLGISSGASLAAISHHIKEMKAGETALTFCYDTGERYFSVDGLF